MPMQRISTGLLFGLALILTLALSTAIHAQQSDPGLPMADPESVGMSSERLARIAPAMQQYIDDQLVPGVVTLVARKGKVVHFETHGYMDVDSGKPMRPDAIFRIASMTKPITSVAIMLLVEDGRVRLTDPVSRHLPELGDLPVAVERMDPETGEVRAVKVPSSDEAPVRGVRKLLSLQDGDAIPPCDVRLGTTLATNALLEARGVPTGVVVTSGLEDALAIGDQRRPALFALDHVLGAREPALAKEATP